MQTPAQFDMSLNKEVETIFKEFRDAYEDKIIVKDFIEILKKSGVSGNCLMLMKKLEKKENELLDKKQFQDLFNFDLRQQENLNLLFDIISQTKPGQVTATDLKKISEKYRNASPHYP